MGCIKLDPNQKPFNIKSALQNLSFELRTCRKKNSKLSPFEAHYGRKANTAITKITSKPNIKNLNWSNTLKYYLDDNIIGEEELISQEKWYDEDLDSENEVRATKERKLQEAKVDKGEVPRIIKLPSANFEQPLARNSPRLQLARKTLADSRNKKQLQGPYEAIPEGAALVKTADSTVTIKVLGQQDTVLNKSDVAKFGTPEQRHIPLINFAARKTVRNHHAKFISSIESHAQDIKSKLIGQQAIQKRETTTSNVDKKAKANLSKVNNIKIPHKKCYQPSPKKGSPKKRKLSTESSQASDEEQDNEPLDSKAATKHHGSTYTIDSTKASTRRSARDKKTIRRSDRIVFIGRITGLGTTQETTRRYNHCLILASKTTQHGNNSITATQRNPDNHPLPKPNGRKHRGLTTGPRRGRITW